MFLHSPTPRAESARWSTAAASGRTPTHRDKPLFAVGLPIHSAPCLTLRYPSAVPEELTCVFPLAPLPPRCCGLCWHQHRCKFQLLKKRERPTSKKNGQKTWRTVQVNVRITKLNATRGFVRPGGQLVGQKVAKSRRGLCQPRDARPTSPGAVRGDLRTATRTARFGLGQVLPSHWVGGAQLRGTDLVVWKAGASRLWPHKATKKRGSTNTTTPSKSWMGSPGTRGAGGLAQPGQFPSVFLGDPIFGIFGHFLSFYLLVLHPPPNRPFHSAFVPFRFSNRPLILPHLHPTVTYQLVATCCLQGIPQSELFAESFADSS